MTPAGIDTAKLYPILMSSGLPREALGQIWASANRTTPGMLTKEELYTVLALIGVAQVNIKEAGWQITHSGETHSLSVNGVRSLGISTGTLCGGRRQLRQLSGPVACSRRPV